MPVQTGILDEFTEVTQVAANTYKLETFSRSSGGRGPFRQIEGQWGGLKDLVNVTLSNGLDIVLYRGSRGLLIRPFVRIVNTDRLLVDIAQNFPGWAANQDYERHGLKYSLGFNDPTGLVTGFGFEFNPFGVGVGLTPGLQQEIIGYDGSGNPIYFDLPIAVVTLGGVELFTISSYPMLKPGDPEWRPYRSGNKVRVDLSPEVGKRIELDPTGYFGTTANLNGFIIVTTDTTPFIAVVGGTVKAIGKSAPGATGSHYYLYDRFDLSSLPAGAVVSAVDYKLQMDTIPYGGSGAPDNAVWRVWSGWNILSDPLVASDWLAVSGQSGRYEYDFDDNTIQNPVSKQIVHIPIDSGWIRGNGSDLHDIEVKDYSAYSGGNYRSWNILRSSPLLGITYTVPTTAPLLYTPHAGI